MPFPEEVTTRALIRAEYSCEACAREWFDLLKLNNKIVPIWSHSSSTFHGVKNKKTGIYYATCVPSAQIAMKGRPIKPDTFLFQRMGRDDDAYCLCFRCHRRVHAIASDITKRKLGRVDYKNAIPYVLENVTISFILNKGKWTY